MVYLEYTGGIVYARDVEIDDAGTVITVNSSYGNGFDDISLHGDYTIADNDNIRQLINTGIYDIVTTLVTNMSTLFMDKTSFNGDIGGWDVSNVTNMKRMFKNASSYNGDISRWDVSSVVDMKEMFQNASSFNGDISGWDVSSVIDMERMFSDTDSFTKSIRMWNVSENTNVIQLFFRSNHYIYSEYGLTTTFMNSIGSITDISNYFNQTIQEEIILVNASSSGDPHVFPVFGQPYELPTTPGIYRMLQGNNFIVNASTRTINANEREQIQTYFKARGASAVQIQRLVDDGCFYHKMCIFCKNMTFSYDFDQKKVTFANKASSQYFNITTDTSSNMTSPNEFERCEALARVIVSFEHDTYGPLSLHLNYFSNPQIKYGMTFITYDVEGLSGLLMREYEISSMQIDSLDNTCKQQGKIGTNSVKTQLLIL